MLNNMMYCIYCCSTIGHDGTPYVKVLKVNTLRSLRKISNMDRALLGFDLDAGLPSFFLLLLSIFYAARHRSSAGFSLECSSIVCICCCRLVMDFNTTLF